jgi:hypothetical protein
VLIFQVNITHLAKLTSAVTLGVVGGAKIVPMWLATVVLGGTLDASRLNLAGAALVLLGSAVWACSQRAAAAPCTAAREDALAPLRVPMLSKPPAADAVGSAEADYHAFTGLK